MNDKVHMFKDVDLFAALYLMRSEIERDEGSYQGIRKLIADWNEELKYSGPGTIGLGFDKLTLTSAMYEQLVHLLSVVKDDVTRQGVVPAATLNRLSQRPGIWFVDYPGEFIIATIDKLLELIDSAPRTAPHSPGSDSPGTG